MNIFKFTLEQKDRYNKVRTRITEVKTNGNVYNALRLVQKEKTYKGYTLKKAEVLKDAEKEEYQVVLDNSKKEDE